MLQVATLLNKDFL